MRLRDSGIMEFQSKLLDPHTARKSNRPEERVSSSRALAGRMDHPFHLGHKCPVRLQVFAPSNATCAPKNQSECQWDEGLM